MKKKGEETLLGVLLNIRNVTIETIEIVTLQKHLLMFHGNNTGQYNVHTLKFLQVAILVQYSNILQSIKPKHKA